jgi:hypothetical protein
MTSLGFQSKLLVMGQFAALKKVQGTLQAGAQTLCPGWVGLLPGLPVERELQIGLAQQACLP